jgi:hypothetical protein
VARTHYTPAPEPAPPPGWRKYGTNVWKYETARGEYQVKRVAHLLFAIWLRRPGAPGFEHLPLTYDLLDAWAVVEDYDLAPYEITDTMTRRMPY